MTFPSVLVVTNSFPFLDFNQTKSEIGSEWDSSRRETARILFSFSSKITAVPFAHPAPSKFGILELKARVIISELQRSTLVGVFGLFMSHTKH